MSERNLDVLQSLAHVIRQLHGPWCVGADFNCTPEQLTQTGWLHLVDGVVKCSGSATCKSVEDDFFVVDRRLDQAVEAVAVVSDTGAGPHSAVRLWLRGDARKDVVRKMVLPAKPEPIPPRGCLPADAHDGWEDIEIPDCASLDARFADWLTRVEGQLADMHSLEGKRRQSMCCRAAGPRFVWKCALGSPASGRHKVSPISVA